MYLSDVDHFPDALSQAANGWVGVESVPTFNCSADERQNISAKNIEDKKLFFSHKNKQYIFAKKGRAYLPKAKIQSIVANKYKNKIFLPKTLKDKNLFAEEVPTFFSENANSVEASSVRHCGCYLGKTCHVHSKKDFSCLSKKGI